MNPLGTIIAELREEYSKAGLNNGDCMMPPVDDAALDNVGNELKLKVPAELRELYSVHGGQEYITPGVTGLFGQYRLITLAEILEFHQMYDGSFSDPLLELPDSLNAEWNWAPQLIPFASWDKYDLCIDSVSGALWEFCPNDGVNRKSPSIRMALYELLAMVRAGVEPRVEDLADGKIWRPTNTE